MLKYLLKLFRRSNKAESRLVRYITLARRQGMRIKMGIA